jgi:hypothetical protein
MAFEWSAVSLDNGVPPANDHQKLKRVKFVEMAATVKRLNNSKKTTTAIQKTWVC